MSYWYPDYRGNCFFPLSASYALLSHTERNRLPYHLDNVQCNGTETELIQCGNRGIGVNFCIEGEAAGVICTSEFYQSDVIYLCLATYKVIDTLYIPADVTCEEGTLHLVGGSYLTRGRVEYCYDGTWQSVCADNWAVTGEEARAVCQTLGYNTSIFGKPIDPKAN